MWLRVMVTIGVCILSHMFLQDCTLLNHDRCFVTGLDALYWIVDELLKTAFVRFVIECTCWYGILWTWACVWYFVHDRFIADENELQEQQSHKA